MKKILLLVYLFLTSLLVFSQQDISKSSIASSAGGQVETNTINISKWSLNEIPLVILQKKNNSSLNEQEWRVSAFPNPFADILHLRFETKAEQAFVIELTDLSGKKLWTSSCKTIVNSQTLEIALNDLPPATYLLSISSQTDETVQIMKVQKGK